MGTRSRVVNFPFSLHLGEPGVRTFVQEWRTVQDKSANTYVVEMAL